MKTLGMLFVIGTVMFASGDFFAQVSCVTPPQGMVSWWRAENDTLDAAGPNHGIGYVLGYTAGKVGNGFRFTGSGDDYVALPWNLFPMPVAGSGTAPFSFDVWFKTTAGGVILGQQDVAPFGAPLGGYMPALYVGTNGLLYAEFFWGGSQIVTANKLNDGVFHHAAVTYDGTAEKLYVDGAFSGSRLLTQQGYHDVYFYQLGTGFTGGWEACPGGWFPFTGTVDEASLWSRALTPVEVALLYGAGSAGKCVPMARPMLAHRYSFSEAPGSRRVADSATGLDGELMFASLAAPYTNGAPDASAFTGTGTLRLVGTNGSVLLPNLEVWPLSTMTLELWLTWEGSPAYAPEQILQFGSQLPAAPVAAPAFLRLSTSQPGSNFLTFESLGGTATNAFILTGPALVTGSSTYIAVTYDPVDGLSQLFVNGVEAAEVRTNLVDSLEEFAGSGNWLGRSHSVSGGFLHGQLDEFRVWEGVLPKWRIAEHFSGGPNQLLQVYPPSVVITRSAGNVQVSWRADLSTGFGLQSAPGLNPGQWKAVDPVLLLNKAWYQVTVPAAGHGFFRLAR